MHLGDKGPTGIDTLTHNNRKTSTSPICQYVLGAVGFLTRLFEGEAYVQIENKLKTKKCERKERRAGDILTTTRT